MSDFDDLIARLEELIGEVDALEEPTRGRVFALLDGIDTLHRTALHRLGDALGDEMLARVRERDPAVAWLFDAYAVDVDERAAAERALDEVRPLIESHGGSIEVRAAQAGVVRVHMAGACAGCTASAVTLKRGVEEALRARFPGFVALEAEEEDAPAHPPPGGVPLPLVQHRGPAPRAR